MSKIIRNAKKRFSRLERGQVLVIVAAAAIGIIAIIGLVMDVGLMFIGNARLRRAVDAAAISAALQYRQGFDTNSLTNAADEFIVLNGFGFTNAAATVDDCFTQPSDPTLCTDPPRKLVRVFATANVKLAFLPVIGIDNIPISAVATSETASLDVVMAIDTSESMTYGDASVGLHPVGDPMHDPYYCNGDAINPGTGNPYVPPTADSNGYLHTSSCQPFFSVISAAINFTNILLPPYDKMAIVTFDKDPGTIKNNKRVPNLEFGDNCPVGNPNCSAAQAKANIISALQGLKVYEGVDAYQNYSTLTDDYRCYGPTNGQCTSGAAAGANNLTLACATTPVFGASTNYLGLVGRLEDNCGQPIPPASSWQYDPTHYATTDIGGGLDMAANELGSDPRQDVLWVVILLTDGVPNAGYSDTSPVAYYCPSSTWGNRSPTLPVCDNGNVSQDWYNGITLWGNASPPARTRPISTNPGYDALAYAFDQADAVGLPFDPATQTGGQGALVYTIGLGSELNNYVISGFTDPVTKATGEGLGTIFMNYAAYIGNGQYYAAPSSTQLGIIFREIGTNIAVRLSK